MEDNGKYTGRTSKVLAFLFGIMTLLYLFRSPIQDLICKNVSLGQRKLPPERDSVYFDEDPLKTSN